MNLQQLENFIYTTWDDSILNELINYIKIPNKSPMFDANWQEHGFMEQAVQQIKTWCEAQQISNMQLDIVRLPNRTPLLFMEIPGNTDRTVLLYGHYDKQPEMTGWDEGLGPWTPVLRDGKLYGRGGADDGYAAFASLTAIKALQQQGIPHPRCVVIIEGCEESGSYDLPYYIETLQDRIGNPDLVVCLDSGAGNYEQLWTTTSLRGLVGGTLKVDILRKGVHSGYASGIVPSSFRIIRHLLNRIENEHTGEILLPELHVEIPEQRVEQAKIAADVLGTKVARNFPFVSGAHATEGSIDELLLKRTWKPALSITGMDGIPSLDNAGNVLRPQTSLHLSMRIPPYCNPDVAAQALKKALENDPPYGAHVSFTPDHGAAGWNAPEVAPWLEQAIQQASQQFFNKQAVYFGEGGSIPFMGMLGEKFPQAQFFITGVLGPKSNAHGPNEFLHIDMGKKLTACVASVIAEQYKAYSA